MKIRIKDVTGENAGYMMELAKAGAKAGTIIDAYYTPENNACHFTAGTDECVAWLGETCELAQAPAR